MADKRGGGFAVCHAPTSSKSRSLVELDVICSVKINVWVFLSGIGPVKPTNAKQMKVNLDALDRQIIVHLQEENRFIGDSTPAYAAFNQHVRSKLI